MVSIPQPQVLAVELESVLVPSFWTPGHQESLQELVSAKFSANWSLIYLTKLSRVAVCASIIRHRLPLPDVVVSEGGAMLYGASDPFMLTPLERFQREMTAALGFPDHRRIDEIMLAHAGVETQDPEYQGVRKRCYRIDRSIADATVNTIKKQISEKQLRVRIETSVTDQDDFVVCDVLAEKASYWPSLQWWHHHQGRSPQATVCVLSSARQGEVPAEAYRLAIATSQFQASATTVSGIYHTSRPHACGVLESCQHYQVMR